MKIKIIIIIAIIALTSCQLLKKDKLTLKKLAQREQLLITEQRNILNQQRRLVLIDSGHQDYTAILWPKGHFKFTVTDGFEGEAEKVLMVSKLKSQKIIRFDEQTKQDSTLLKTTYINEKESIRTAKVNKVGFRYSWLWLLLPALIYMCYWLYKRFC